MSEKECNELRVKVAELCGLKDLIWFSGELHHGPHGLNAAVVPDYPNDLNACHEFEKTLTKKQREQYCYILLDSDEAMMVSECELCAFATAEQRCRAFIATMEKGA